MLSVVIPAYQEEKNIPEITREAAGVLEQAGIDYEMILVDDGSRDGTYAAMQAAAAENARIRGVRLSRNFGKEAAMLAGLETARGDCCVILDADMQHPPDILPEMVRLWQGGAKIVQGVKAGRGRENPFYKVCARAFYGAISRFTGIDFRHSSDYRLLDRRIIDILVALPEKNRFFRGLSVYYGFPQAEVEFSVNPRRFGDRNWRTTKLIAYAIDSVSSFTAFPLQITTGLGAVMLVVFLVLGLQTLYNYGAGRAVEGFTTVILLLLFIASALSISLGVIGHYIGKIYEEVKARPPYIIEKDTAKDKEDGMGSDRR